MLGLFSGISNRRLRLVAPDHTEARGSSTLLIWAGVPHWMVVDAEMAEFLRSFDSQRTVGQLIDACEPARADRKTILATVEDLTNRGVLVDARHQDRSPADSDDLPKIQSVSINLTRRCSQRCVFCYNAANLRADATDELSDREFVSFLDEVRPLCVDRPSLVILGGEPLLESEKLLTIASHASKSGWTCVVSTNGLSITAEFARRARSAGLQVQVSIEGHTPELNDPIRGRGSFDGALHGIRILIDAGVHTILSMVCHEGNLPHLGDFYELAISLGAAEARFIPLKSIGAAKGGSLRAAPLPKLMRSAFDLFRSHPEYLKLTGRDAFSILANTCRYSARRDSCGTGLQTVLLDADGSIYPCLNINCAPFRIANIRDGGYRFVDVWRSSAALKDFRDRTSLKHPGRVCRECAVRQWCLGGCRGEAWATAGNLAAPSPNCNELRRAMLDMMWRLAESPDLVKPMSVIC